MVKHHLVDQGGPFSVQPLGRGGLPGECGRGFYRYVDTRLKDGEGRLASRISGFKATLQVLKLPRLSAAL
ncbi:MAG: hypothetical protein M3122_05785 [Actinomycetota bacterium]|nr:hypothetical protein [Actinomycetota bacterium]